MKIILDGVLETLATKQDGSVSIKFSTQELDSSKGGELFQLRGKYCKALFSDTNITTLDAELVDNTSIAGLKKKTPSQRLRAILFRVHEQSDLQISFEDYYNNELNKICEHYKSKLE